MGIRGRKVSGFPNAPDLSDLLFRLSPARAAPGAGCCLCGFFLLELQEAVLNRLGNELTPLARRDQTTKVF
jgi:hypothetical protein